MKYAIIEEDLGFFLGAHQKYGIFAGNDSFGIPKAYAFTSEEEAEEYIKEFLGPHRGEWKIVGIETKDKYIHVVDLIKEGYSKYTHNMIEGLPMISTQIH